MPVLASFTVIGTAARVGPAVSSCAQAATVHHAALVVEHSNGAVIKVCVSFTADSITGDQLLASSGVQYATADYGSTGKAVCQIDGEPSSYPSGCWTASSPYWAMFVSRAGASWQVSSLGISSQTFRDGDAEGFRYESQSSSAVPPSPAGVCPLPSSPTPAPVRTPTPIPRGTSTAVPRSTVSQAMPSPSTAIPVPSPSSVQPSASNSSGSVPTTNASARAGIATSRSTTPPAPPPLLSTGAWAASILGAGLLILLVVQVVRAQRRPSPPGWQP
ncbi:MAG TPA: hypothetical protein VG520_07755 [Candidatus Dormibacteraeota bacterium]|nr:hypothetical protein [Candidatus Dormibacteraeota bacterium]